MLDCAAARLCLAEGQETTKIKMAAVGSNTPWRIGACRNARAAQERNWAADATGFLVRHYSSLLLSMPLNFLR